MPTFVLGVQFGEVIGIIVLVISVLSWFVNVVQGNAAAGNQRQQRQPPKPQPPRNEIEELLKGLAGEKRPAQQRPPNPPQPVRPKPPVEKPRTKPNPALQKPGNRPPVPPRQTARVTVADSKLPQSDLGPGVRHQPFANRAEITTPTLGDAPTSHELGNRIAPASQVPDRPIHPLVKVLRDSNGIRQAILLNEILQPPRSLRR